MLLLLMACQVGPPEPTEPGSLALTYSWEGFDTYPESCAGAWAESVWVELVGENETSDQAYPCDNNGEVFIDRLTPGEWTVTLRTVQDIETADRGWNLSEPVDFTVVSEETTDLDVAIVCYDDGVEDRCSGL